MRRGAARGAGADRVGLAQRRPRRVGRAKPRRCPPPPLPRTNRTSLVPPLVLSGHAASLTPYPKPREAAQVPARRARCPRRRACPRRPRPPWRRRLGRAAALLTSHRAGCGRRRERPPRPPRHPLRVNRSRLALAPRARRRDETCPVSTGGGTRRVQSVREGGGGGASFAGADRRACGAARRGQTFVDLLAKDPSFPLGDPPRLLEALLRCACALADSNAAGGAGPPGGAQAPPPPLPRTNRTSLVPPLVLSGHAASLTTGAAVGPGRVRRGGGRGRGGAGGAGNAPRAPAARRARRARGACPAPRRFHRGVPPAPPEPLRH